MFNPILAMLCNEKTGRWHPIMFKESPLPGPPSKDKPIRHKSHGHHTIGFDTREEAMEAIDKMIEAAKDEMPVIKKYLDKDIPWDGEETPVMVRFFESPEN